MSYKITSIRKYFDQKLHVYKRDDSRFWLCRFYVDGKYKVKSTGAETLRDAKSFAEIWYEDLRYKQRHGVPVHDKKFSVVVKEYLEYQQTLVKNYERSVKTGTVKRTGRTTGKFRTKRQSKDYQFRINQLNKYFSTFTIGNIKTRDIDDYINQRLKTVKETTIKYDLVALSLLFQFSQEKEYINVIPLFPKLDVSNTNPRSSFTIDEWKDLLDASNDRIKNAPNKRTQEQRRELHNFMVFSVHTGLRVNETLRVKYGDIKVDKTGKETCLIISNVIGKNDVREVIGVIGAVGVYKRMFDEKKPKPDDLLFPHHHRDALNSLLDASNLKLDNRKNVRNARSFRSTYIMFRLMFGVSSDDIRINCGNSIFVIEKYYAKYITPKDVKDRLSAYPK